jgi:hypothetical protein
MTKNTMALILLGVLAAGAVAVTYSRQNSADVVQIVDGSDAVVKKQETVAQQNNTTQTNTNATTNTNTNTTIKKEVTAGPVSSCGLKVATSGGTFIPKTCEFQMVLAGASGCGAEDPRGCPPSYDYQLLLEDGAAGHIRTLTLMHIKSTASGTYRLDGTSKEFSGAIIDAGSAVRNLQNGTLVLDWKGDTTSISFDTTFSNSIHVTASGVVPVKTIAAE